MIACGKRLRENDKGLDKPVIDRIKALLAGRRRALQRFYQHETMPLADNRILLSSEVARATRPTAAFRSRASAREPAEPIRGVSLRVRDDLKANRAGAVNNAPVENIRASRTMASV